VATNADAAPRILLLCEELPAKYAPVLQTHGIELHAIGRRDFLEIAAKRCPNTLARHFLAYQDKIASNESGSWGSRPDMLAPLEWSHYRSSLDLLVHFEQELARFGFDKYKLFKPYQQEVFNSLEGAVGRRYFHVPEALYSPQYWNLESLKRREYKTVQEALEAPPGYRAIRKPIIELRPYITTKHNLSVVWRPYENLKHRNDDFRYVPREEAYAYERPPNEILFVKNVLHLTLDDPTNPPRYTSELSMIIDEYLLGLLWAVYQEIIAALSLFADVRETADFEFDLYEDDDERFKDIFRKPIMRPKAWRIYDVEAREREREEAWIHGFVESYGLSPQEFIQAWDRAGSRPRRSLNNAYKYLHEEGVDMDPGTAQAVNKRLREKHAWIVDHAVSRG
jgi:hypothetical protein